MLTAIINNRNVEVPITVRTDLTVNALIYKDSAHS